jgi:chromosome segregation ATPase
MDNEQIEEKLKKGYLEESYHLWKSRNFEYLNSLSAGSNFYYLRQLLLFIEKNSDSSKIQEKDEEIKNLVASYETLQNAFEGLKLEKKDHQEDFFMSTENFEESEIVKMNEELLEQIDYLETSKAELESVLRSKVKEFSLEIENFVQISEEKSRKILELSDLLSEIEEKYQGELEKLRLENTMIVKKLEDNLERVENQKNELEEDCKGLQQHKKIYEQSLEEFKQLIQRLENTISEISAEKSKLQVQVNDMNLTLDGLMRNVKTLENENSAFLVENQTIARENQLLIQENQVLENESQALIQENHSLSQKNEFLTQENFKFQDIVKELKREVDEKCNQVFRYQEESKDLGKINADQAETIINLNSDLNRFKRQLKSSSRDLDQKNSEVDTVRKSLERFRNDYSKESSRLLESCSSKITKKKRELSVQSIKLSKLQSTFQTLSYENEVLLEKLQTLDSENQSHLQKINSLLEKNTNHDK